MNTPENIAYWDQRASLGPQAGSQDLIAKRLEHGAILGAIETSLRFRRVLEVGCGTGETAYLVASNRTVLLDAIDSSIEMIGRAIHEEPAYGRAWFMVGDVMNPPEGPYDLVYSQRCLINLPSWEAQKQAIDAIADRLVPGGRFLMCENSQDGLDAINEARHVLELPAIQRPWHNRYFKDSELATVTSLRLVRCEPFSATYYYHSRVINAALAAKAGQAPDYDAAVNRLALTLPADCVDPRFAQGRLWIWAKA